MKAMLPPLAVQCGNIQALAVSKQAMLKTQGNVMKVRVTRQTSLLARQRQLPEKLHELLP